MLSFTEQFLAARRVAVPLIGIETADPGATMKTLLDECSETPKPAAMLTWNSATGMVGLNVAGEKIASLLNDNPEVVSPVAFLTAIADEKVVPAWTIIGMHAAPDWFDNPVVRQAIWNLRDKFKRNCRTLVLLSTIITLPDSLKNDVIIIDEPLPTEEQLRDLATKLDVQATRCDCDGDSKCKKCGGTKSKIKRPVSNEETINRVVESVKGLPYFGAEQVISMALRAAPVVNQTPTSCIDLEHCWVAKRKQVEQTKGLQIHRGGTTFSDLGGLDHIKNYLSRIMTGRKPPKVIVWLDEIEKTGVANRNDSSGVNQDQEGTLLSWMEDYRVFGLLLLGVPGCGKSEICKAVGNEFDRVVIRVDLGAMQGSLVGESQQNIRAALKVVQAIGGTDTMWLATANSNNGLSTAMKSRFTNTFFFDLPTREERLSIWDVWLKKYELSDKPFKDDEGWVARNIRNCCYDAWHINETVKEAASTVVPLGIQDRENVKALRTAADNRYLCATRPGIYQVPRDVEQERAFEPAERAFSL